MELTSKNVLITGGANGIGRTLVERMRKAGANVGVFDLDRAALDRLQADHPEVHCAICDVGDVTQVAAEVDRFVERFRTIDVLVNNAAYITNSPLIRLSPEGILKHDIELWNKIVQVDLNGVFYMTVHVVEKMIARRTKGVVINLSSIAAGGNAGQGAYSAAKAGVAAMTVAWAKELGAMRIRFVAVAPGFIDTETTVGAVETNVLDGWKKQTPLRRLGKPDEIASTIEFAIANDFVNGRVLEVDGGLRL
jgi:3-oxoacyl-[acyl-carrier protein] reductase